MGGSSLKIIVTGGQGQLGQEFQYLSKSSNHQFHFFSRNNLDITDKDQLNREVAPLQPDIIINCAAYTSVDRAEQEVESAFTVNAFGAHHLARLSKECNALLIHFSTDYVYHLDVDRPLNELDACNPRSIYGISKWTGEQMIRRAGCRQIIFRVSWLYSTFNNNFVKTMLRLGRERDELSVVSDQQGAPTYARDLAQFVLNNIDNQSIAKSHGETYNFCNQGVTNWADFARHIFRLSGIDCLVRDTTTEEYGALAPRPLWSVLDLEKISERFSFNTPHWQESLARCLEELKWND